MPLWRVKDDRGLRRHELASGFGHSLMLATLSGAFETLRISASVCDGPRWWSLHFEPSVITFELEHGIEGGRAEYDGANLARARQSRAPVCGTYSGFSDLFAPIVARGEVIATLVTGPFLLRRPTSRGALERYRMLTGREGHLSDPEFCDYFSAILRTLVLEGESFVKFRDLCGCIAQLIAGEGDAQAAANRASELRFGLESRRWVDRTWEAVRAMLDERSPKTWASAARSWPLGELGLSTVPDDVLVGLTIEVSKSDEPVELAFRRDALQRDVVDLARRSGRAIAGRVGPHGVVLLVVARGSTGDRRGGLLELSERIRRLARSRYGLGMHFGASAAHAAVPRSASFQSALGAAERALVEQRLLVIAEAEAAPAHGVLRKLREELRHPAKSSTLESRFERYLEAVATRSAHDMAVARAHLESGFERAAEPLLVSGAVERRDFEALCAAADRASAAARSEDELCDTYRRAIADLAQALALPVRARHDRSLRAAVEYIQRHFTERLDFGAVARQAGYNPTYFSRLFREREKMTFERYVRSLRLERARHLLSSTDLEVSRVASQSGFATPQYFSYVFCRELGMTPLAFRVKQQQHRPRGEKARRTRRTPRRAEATKT